ncbi:tetratricopeptide repeat protein [Patescibacteria group bacterium]|nr:MAG: tetratricopeptide repeat protein [Patescibacteria group bacterium]
MDKTISSEGSSALVTRLDKIASGILIALAFLLPVFFIPSLSVPFQLMKMLVLVVGVLVAFLLWIVARLKDGVIVLPKTYVLLFALLIPVAVFVSGLTVMPKISMPTAFIGQGGEVGTVASVIVLFLSMILVVFLARSKARVRAIFNAFFIATAVIALFEIIRLMPGTDLLSLGVFTDKASNFIGKWNELGIFFGLPLIFSMLALENLSLKKSHKVLVWIAYAISLVLFVAVNFSLAFYLLGIFSLLLFVYLYVFNKQALVKVTLAKDDGDTTPAPAPEKKKFPISPIITFVVAFVFIVDGFITSAPLQTKISGLLQVSQTEVSMPWSATAEISKNSIKEDPVFGIGPNRFINRYLVSKPLDMNSSVLWSADFNYATGLIPSFIVTTGLLGALVWILFLVSFFSLGIRYLLLGMSAQRYFAASSFLVASYLWLVSIFYVPNVVLFSLAFLFSGLFVALLVQEKTIKTVSVAFLKNPKVGFVSVLVLVVIMILTVAGLYKYTQRFLSGYYFQQSLVDLNVKGDIASAEMNMLKAVDYSKTDLYYRSLSEINLLKIDRLLATTSNNRELITRQLDQFSVDAINSANEARRIDPLNYQNSASLGRIYEAFVPLGVTGAYQAATNVYLEAVKLNPNNPALFLILARLEVTNKKPEEAKKYIAKALEIKPDYGEALFLRSQLESSDGDAKAAIATMITVASLYPSDPNVFFQLGVLQYNSKDYASAVPSFERAVILNNYYSNARYFLGLSYANLNRDKDAIIQFEIIEKIDPNSKAEVDLIIENIQAGRAPLAKPVKVEETKKPVKKK